MEDRPDYITDVSELMGWNEPKQIVTEVSGFVMIFDCVLQRYNNLTKAAVHGAMFRFCHMKDNVCKASLTTIGEMLGVNKATVMRYAKELCEDGYFLDLTPELRNKPHVYADTGIVKVRNRFDVAQNNAGVAQLNSGVAGNNASVAQSKLSKVNNRDSRKLKKDNGAERTPLKANQIPQIILFREITRRYPAKGSQFTVITSVDKVSDRLGRDATPQDLEPFYREWCDRGYNPVSVKWLSEWAVPGVVPTNGHKKSTADVFSVIDQTLGVDYGAD